jgi:hypothetical protein
VDVFDDGRDHRTLPRCGAYQQDDVAGLQLRELKQVNDFGGGPKLPAVRQANPGRGVVRFGHAVREEHRTRVVCDYARHGVRAHEEPRVILADGCWCKCVRVRASRNVHAWISQEACQSPPWRECLRRRAFSQIGRREATNATDRATGRMNHLQAVQR